MSGHKLDLADDEDISYVSDCDICSSKVFDDTGLCQSCWELESQEKLDQEAATRLMRVLNLPLYHTSSTSHYHIYSIQAVDLYRILTDKDKLKEFIFKLNNRAFI